MSEVSPTRPKAQRWPKQLLIGGQHEIDDIVKAVRTGKCCRLIGPRYHHKSRIMREACDRVARQLGHISLYVSMWDARVTTEAAFFASIRDLMARKSWRYYRKRLPRPTIRSASELKRLLTDAPKVLHANVALFLDDLEAVPPDYLNELLRILRAAFEETANALRFVAVVCASNNLARAALGPTSPFESISELVLVRDLSEAETRELAGQLVSATCPYPTHKALQLIHEQTGGDRALVSEICRECCRLLSQGKRSRITQDVVRAAIENLTQHGGRDAMKESLQQIENDPDLLRAILRIMRAGEIAATSVLLDPFVQPNPLTTSGFVSLRDRQFKIKSDLHYQLLSQYFTSERVGRIFLASGDWESAIDYLGTELQRNDLDKLDERARVMFGAISAMYSMPNRSDAWAYLIRGLTIAYPKTTCRLYNLDRAQGALIEITAPRSSAKIDRAPQIPLSASQEPEIRALLSPHDYTLQPNGHQLTLYVPLRSADIENLGLVTITGFVTRADFQRKHHQILEIVGYVQRAARALKNRLEHETLLQSAEQRARDLRHLLDLTSHLINTNGSFDDVLHKALLNARAALRRQAQMGSIYLYDRKTGLVTMRAHTGFPPNVEDAAKFVPGKGLAGYVYKTRRPCNIKDTSFDHRYQPIPATERYRVRSAIGVPLLGRNGLLGVLCLDNMKQTNAFDDESEKLLMLFAGEVASWLENARLLEILRDLNSTIIALRELSSSNAQPVFDKLAEQLMRNFDLNGCAIGLKDEGEISFVVRRNLPELPKSKPIVDLPAPLARNVLVEGQTLVPSNWPEEHDDWQDLLHAANYTSLVALPLLGDQGYHGLVLLVSVGEFNPSEEELGLLRTFSTQVTIAHENANLYRNVNGELESSYAELMHTNRQLERAYQELEIARRREVQHRNARLATGLLHQINSAIANIPELVDELDNFTWPQAAHEPLQDIKRSSLVASQISQWLNQFVKLGNLQIEPVNIILLINDVVHQLESQRPRHVSPPQVRVTQAVPLLSADRALLGILLENLLRNAYEAIPSGQPGEIIIDLTVDRTWCQIRLCDNGVGVPVDKRDKIWEWGWTTKQAGTTTHDRGLGLYACRQIVDGHAGTIELEISPGNQGAVFLVQLPLAGPPTTLEK